MAIEIIVKDDSGKQVEITVDLENDQDWEEICYQVGCEVARGKNSDSKRRRCTSKLRIIL